MDRLKREENYFESAKGDARSIENNIGDYKICASQICFNAQQLVEKLLKSIYSFYGLKPEKTHDLRRLASDLAGQGYLDIDDHFKRNCGFLTQNATSSRYIPFESSEYGEVLEAVIAANEIAEYLEKQGYDVIKIDVPARRLRDIFVDEHENVEDLDKLMADKISESALYSADSQDFSYESKTRLR